MFSYLFPTIMVAAVIVTQYGVICQDIMDIDGFDADLNFYGQLATTPRPATTSVLEAPKGPLRPVPQCYCNNAQLCCLNGLPVSYRCFPSMFCQ